MFVTYQLNLALARRTNHASGLILRRNNALGLFMEGVGETATGFLPGSCVKVIAPLGRLRPQDQEVNTVDLIKHKF